MNSSVIDCARLAALLDSPTPPVLVDVRPETSFEREHLPGAKNNCVFEVAFLDRMPEAVPDRSQPVCVYGECSDSEESAMAAEKLIRQGYQQVYELRCGIGQWCADGRDTLKDASVLPALTPVPDGTFPIDLKESRVQWIGRNLLNSHEGTLALKSGDLVFEKGMLSGGEFVIDMHSIRSTDLEGNELHDVLIRHLMDHDFFEVETYPEGRFVIDRAEPLEGANPGSPDLKIHGMLTLKDVTAPLEFLATHGFTDKGKAAAQATLSFDRTKWNVKYGSGRLFRNLGGHLVNDRIELQLRIVTA